MADPKLVRMEEKWRMTFFLMDVDKDGVISANDRKLCKDAFSRQYKDAGKDIGLALKKLDEFWNLAVFLTGPPDWSQEITAESFVQTRKESFLQDEATLQQVARNAVRCLMEAADITGDRQFPFERILQLHEAFGVKNEELVRALFNLMGPDGTGSCSQQAVEDFYVEFIIGDDVEKHEMIKGMFQP